MRLIIFEFVEGFIMFKCFVDIRVGVGIIMFFFLFLLELDFVGM